MIHRPSWRMREEGEMVACVAECPECHSPASVVVSSDLLRPPLSELPELRCPKCRKRFRVRAKDLSILSVKAHRCG